MVWNLSFDNGIGNIANSDGESGMKFETKIRIPNYTTGTGANNISVTFNREKHILFAFRKLFSKHCTFFISERWKSDVCENTFENKSIMRWARSICPSLTHMTRIHCLCLRTCQIKVCFLCVCVCPINVYWVRLKSVTTVKRGETKLIDFFGFLFCLESNRNLSKQLFFLVSSFMNTRQNGNFCLFIQK